MSDDGINWYVFIYPAVAIPIVILGVVRWRMMRKRQLENLQAISKNAENGHSAQDFIVGNPYVTPYTVAVQNVEQDRQRAAMAQSASYNVEPPAYEKNAKQNYKKSSKIAEEEPPKMIQTKRWF